jgi:hypothetical protein
MSRPYASTDEMARQRERVSRTRAAAGETLAAVGSVVADAKRSGLASKIAVARAAIGLIRRYPVPALCIAGIGVALLLASSRHGHARRFRR